MGTVGMRQLGHDAAHGLQAAADGRRFIADEDGALRRLPAYGAFREATAASAMAVLHIGNDRHGRLASIMTDRGSQFFANGTWGRRRGLAGGRHSRRRFSSLACDMSWPGRTTRRLTARSGGSKGDRVPPCLLRGRVV